MKQLLSLTIVSLKMYYRNKIAIFFSLFIPLMIIVIFGVILGNDSVNKLNLAIVNNSKSDISKGFVTAIENANAFKVQELNFNEADERLKKGDEDIVLVIPETFNEQNIGNESDTIAGYFDQQKSQNAGIGFLIINNILDKFNAGIYSKLNSTAVPEYLVLQQKGIQTKNLGSIDFLIPGIIAFSIMQLGLFSVAFGFTTMKKTGALRRLHVTPVKPAYFIIAQAAARLILSLMQVLILLAVGIWAFKLHMYGDVFTFLVAVALGSSVFLAIGFAIAGYSKDENQAAPITNIISFPMIFLSGTFFPLSSFPDWLKNITAYLPLTYLSDALRQIANNGSDLLAIRTDIIGLIVWLIVSMIIAVLLFRWE